MTRSNDASVVIKSIKQQMKNIATRVTIMELKKSRQIDARNETILRDAAVNGSRIPRLSYK